MENEMEQIRNSLTQPQHTADRGNGRKKWQHQREYLLNFQCNHQHLQLQFHRASPSSSRMDSTFCCCFFCVELCFCEAYTKRNVGMKQKKRRIKNRKKYTNKRSRNKSRLEKLTFGQSLPLPPTPSRPATHACMNCSRIFDCRLTGQGSRPITDAANILFRFFFCFSILRFPHQSLFGTAAAADLHLFAIR